MNSGRRLADSGIVDIADRGIMRGGDILQVLAGVGNRIW